MPQETIELFYDDLSREKQQEILKLLKIRSPDEMNWYLLAYITVIKKVTILSFPRRRESR